jgi:hypothetical protein
MATPTATAVITALRMPTVTTTTVGAIWYGSGSGLPMVGVCGVYKFAVDVSATSPAGSHPAGFLSAQDTIPSVENVAAPFNGAIRVGDCLLAIASRVFACPRQNRVGSTVVENSGLGWVEFGHRP